MQVKKGSYLMGILGAFLGSLIACIPFIIVFKLGYIVFWLAFLFVVLAAKGYDMLGGRVNYFRILAVGFFSINALILSVFAVDIYDLAQVSMQTNEFTFTEIPEVILYVMATNSEYRNSVIFNLGISLLVVVIANIYSIVETVKLVQAYKNMSAHNQATAENYEVYDYQNPASQSFAQPYPNGNQNSFAGQSYPNNANYSNNPNNTYNAAPVNNAEQAGWTSQEESYSAPEETTWREAEEKRPEE